MEYKFIDLFAGIGGFHRAFYRAVKRVDKFKKTNNSIKCVLASEIDQNAKLVYSKNYGMNIEEIVNIREIENCPDHDFLFGGFPCQAFSNAGKKQGFLDNTRGTLFFDIAKILQNKQPKYFVLENVKHLVKHDGGKTWYTIQKVVDELGYTTTLKPLILSAKDVGVPQNRERVYIIGVRNDLLKNKENKSLLVPKMNYNSELGIQNIFEKEIDKKFLLKDKKILESIKAWGVFLENVKTMENRTLPVIWLDEMMISDPKIRKKMLANSVEWRQKYLKDMWWIYDNNKTFIDEWCIKYDMKNKGKREKKFEWQAGQHEKEIKKSFIQLRQSGIRCRKMTSFPTLVAMVQTPIIYDLNFKGWRYITPKEAGKLQSFYSSEDKDIFKSYYDLSENKDNIAEFYAYKQFGNSINIEVVTQLIEFILKKEYEE